MHTTEPLPTHMESQVAVTRNFIVVCFLFVILLRSNNTSQLNMAFFFFLLKEILFNSNFFLLFVCLVWDIFWFYSPSVKAQHTSPKSLCTEEDSSLGYVAKQVPAWGTLEVFQLFQMRAAQSYLKSFLLPPPPPPNWIKIWKGSFKENVLAPKSFADYFLMLGYFKLTLRKRLPCQSQLACHDGLNKQDEELKDEQRMKKKSSSTC